MKNKIAIVILAAFIFSQSATAQSNSISVYNDSNDPEDSAFLIELLECLQTNHGINWELGDHENRTKLYFLGGDIKKIRIEFLLAKNFELSNMENQSFTGICDTIAYKINNPAHAIPENNNSIIDEKINAAVDIKKERDPSFLSKNWPWLAGATAIAIAGLIVSQKQKGNSSKPRTNIFIEQQ